MLGHEDERRFAAIEQQLLRDDPAFVRPADPTPPGGKKEHLAEVVAAGSGCLCALATVVVLLAGSGALALLFLAMTVAAVYMFRRGRGPRRRLR